MASKKYTSPEELQLDSPEASLKIWSRAWAAGTGIQNLKDWGLHIDIRRLGRCLTYDVLIIAGNPNLSLII
jgi:hypothetical protein